MEDITEFIIVKQMLRNYKDGSFGGCSGPSFDNLRKRKLTRQDKVLNKVMYDDSDDEPVELSVDMVNISEMRSWKQVALHQERRNALARTPMIIQH